MNDNKGLYTKYYVSRVDGKPITEGCIVLELKDHHAIGALQVYADTVRSAGFVDMANDLDAVCANMRAGITPVAPDYTQGKQ